MQSNNIFDESVVALPHWDSVSNVEMCKKITEQHVKINKHLDKV